MRALLALMTAAKALSTVHEWFATTEQKSQEVGFRLEMADLWATGEAAASLGFFAARLSDKLDEAEHPSSSDAKLAALFSPAAKLFSSSSIPKCLQQMAKWDEYSVQDANDMRTRLVDAQIEDMYMGPAALQRRLVSAAMTDIHFLAEFRSGLGRSMRLQHACREPVCAVLPRECGSGNGPWSNCGSKSMHAASGFFAMHVRA